MSNMPTKKIGLIFPHQLFKDNPLLNIVDEILIIEDPLFFGDKKYPLHFHKQKLVFHRASMQKYYNELLKLNISVTYSSYVKDFSIKDNINDIENSEVYVVDPTDYILEKRLKESIKNITFIPSPLFINSKEDNEQYIKNSKSYLMHNFYVWQRKRLNILIDENKKPLGGKWSFDEDNRKKIPKSEYGNIPHEPEEIEDPYIDEAKKYVEKNFSKNPGSIEKFIYPIDHASAEKWFQDFLKERFLNFGQYEDAITREHNFLYHSLLSPLMNVGLLKPMDIVKKTMKFADQHNIPINSLEGFIRQVIGWREYMRLTYELFGTEMRNSNKWNHDKKIPKAFYDGTTGIEPIDVTIQKILKTGYCHHIERLMILGNFMFLIGIKPDDVYVWFMEMFIDSYDWVMVPNIYAMSQNSDHGLITTKPYVSGSNYVLKMSDYKKGDWCDVWDALYWLFIFKHREYLRKNGRMHFVVSRADKFTKDTIKEYEKIAKEFYKSL